MIRKIEIELPLMMDVPDEVFQKIDSILTEMICKPYKEEHPDRTMWVSGHGAKCKFSRIDSMFLGKFEYDENIKDGDEPVFDDEIYQIEITERAK